MENKETTMSSPPIQQATITIKLSGMEAIEIHINPLDSIEIRRHAERSQESMRKIQRHIADGNDLSDISLEEDFRRDHATFLDATAISLSNIAVFYRDMEQPLSDELDK